MIRPCFRVSVRLGRGVEEDKKGGDTFPSLPITLIPSVHILATHPYRHTETQATTHQVSRAMADRSEYTSKSPRNTYKYDAPARPKRQSTTESLLNGVDEATDTVGKGIVWGAKKTDKLLDDIVDGTVDLWKDVKSVGKEFFSSSSSKTPTSRRTRKHHKSISSRSESSTAKGPTDYRYGTWI